MLSSAARATAGGPCAYGCGPAVQNHTMGHVPQRRQLEVHRYVASHTQMLIQLVQEGGGTLVIRDSGSKARKSNDVSDVLTLGHLGWLG